METLAENFCRVCLTICQEMDSDFEQIANTFEKMTGIQANLNDVPKKICDCCMNNLMHFQEFCERCEETEKILEKYRIWHIENCEVKVVIKTEDVCDAEKMMPDMLDATYGIECNNKKEQNRRKRPGKKLKEITIKKIKELKKEEEHHSPIETNRKNAARTLCCELCGKKIHSNSLKQHMRIHESKQYPETFYCDLCPFTCRLKDRIRFHMRQKHLKLVRYNCKYCDRSYQDFVSLKFHTSNTHTKEFSHICDVCGKGYISKSRLENHAAKHSGTVIHNVLN